MRHKLKIDLVLLTVHTIKALVISSVNVTTAEDPGVKLLHNSFVIWICCANELVM